jgi:hypothetical protein
VSILIVFGGVSGLIILLSTIVVIGRGIFKQVTATEDNTTAVRELTQEVAQIKSMYQNHETRITVLEDRIKR